MKQSKRKKVRSGTRKAASGSGGMNVYLGWRVLKTDWLYGVV
jgi:hypothetical protein